MLRINVGRRFRPHAVQRHQLLERQIVQIRHALHQAAVHQLIDQRVAHAIDIHHAARSEMQDRFLQPRRAIGVDAAAGRFALFAHHVAAANRARFRHAERLAVRALLLTRTTFGITSPLRSTTTVSPICTPSRSISSSLCSVARDTVTPLTFTGLQVRHRRQSAGAAHLHLDVDDLGLAWRAAIFEGDGPARRFGGESELPLLRDAVHLEHHAVDLIRQRLAPGFPLAAERQHLLDVAAQAAAADSP